MSWAAWFAIACLVGLYGASARILIQSHEMILSKHPLFLYSVAFLAALVLAMRMEGKSKTILLFIECVVFAFVLLILNRGF